MNNIDGGVTAPKGFTAAGVAAHIKKVSDKKDCALIVSEPAAVVAGMFTTNVMKSPPVFWDVEVCKKGVARAVFINSGNANACTGEQGRADVADTAERVALGLGDTPDRVCISSTGVIGVPLPMDRIAYGVETCLRALSPEGHTDAAEAIMTTDKVRKELACEVELSGGTVRLGAMAKGSGMIAPNMATMICIITTDADVDKPALDAALRQAVAVSFNQICVDNDMSTSDTVLCLANGQSGVPRLAAGSADQAAFAKALTELCRAMARLLVQDGEGATKFVEIAVEGAATDAEAKTIARAIAQSQLCKTAFFGQDPNWGRLACAAGYAGVAFDPESMNLWLGDIQLMHNGGAARYNEADAAAVMQRPEFRIRIAVGNGPGAAEFWTSDLSHEYVSINADYRS